MAATLGFDVTAVCALNLKLSCFSVESSLQWHLVRQFFLLRPPSSSDFPHLTSQSQSRVGQITRTAVLVCRKT